MTPVPGRLRYRCEIRRGTETEAGDADSADVYTLIDTTFCDLVPVGMQMRFGSAQTGERVTHRATMRYREDLREYDYLHIDGRQYRVRGWQPWDGRTHYILVEVEEEALV